MFATRACRAVINQSGMSQSHGLSIEGLHTENRPALLEQLSALTRRRTAPTGGTIKTFMKVLAQRQGMMGEFHGQRVGNVPGRVAQYITYKLRDKNTDKSASTPMKAQA